MAKTDIKLMQFQLIQVLQNNMTVKRKLAKSGRLEPSRLAMKDASPFLFSQKMPDTGKSYKCDFLLDVSGSMYGSGSNTYRIGKAIKDLQGLISIFNGIIDFRIICYGHGMFPVSANTILSIDYNSNSDIRSKLNPTMGAIEVSPGNYQVVKWEGGCHEADNATFGSYALAKSIEEMTSMDGDRFIVLLTDGCFHSSSYGVNGTDADRHAPRHMNDIINQGKSEGINILPIQVDCDRLEEWFPNPVSGGADKTYEGVINFINNNFNK